MGRIFHGTEAKHREKVYRCFPNLQCHESVAELHQDKVEDLNCLFFVIQNQHTSFCVAGNVLTKQIER